MKLQSVFLLLVAGISNAEARLAGTTKRELAPPNKERLNVMTRNLYIGASIDRILTATSPEESLALSTQTLNIAFASDFERRMEAIAQEIDKAGSDLVGLQEAYRFTIVDGNVLAGTAAPLVMDLTTLLLAKLQERGLNYSVASRNAAQVLENALVLPFNVLGAQEVTPGCNVPINGIPSLPPVCALTLEDFDVILVNDDAQQVEIQSSDSGTYAAQLQLTLPGGSLASLDRGWTYVDGLIDGQQAFRFINTHLEVADVFNSPQAAELVAGPANVPDDTALILLGDFNSAAEAIDVVPPGRFAFGSGAYETIVGSGIFEDVWTNTPGGGPANGNTFGQIELLDNRQDLSYARIDIIFTGGKASAQPGSVNVVGQRSIDQSTVPYWASDHSGVVATIVFE